MTGDDRRAQRLDAARRVLGLPEDATEAQVLEALERVSEPGVDLGFLAAELSADRGDTRGARRWYEHVTRRARAKADARREHVVGGLDGRLRDRMTVWIAASITGALLAGAASMVVIGVLWLQSLEGIEGTLTDPGELEIVQWLYETQTAELYVAANEVGLEQQRCGGGSGGGGACAPGERRPSLRSPEALLEALARQGGGGRESGSGSGSESGSGRESGSGSESGGGGGGVADMFGVPGERGPAPPPVPPPPPTPPDPPREITLGESRRPGEPMRTCSAIERACEPEQIPAADVQATPALRRTLAAAVSGLRKDGDCGAVRDVIGRARRGETWLLGRRSKALAERYAAWCFLERARARTDGDAEGDLRAVQLHAERAACASPDEAWRAYVLMVSAAMERDALEEASGYLGCARASVREYEERVTHPLDAAEAFAILGAWEWTVMGNEEGFLDAQERAQTLLDSIDPSEQDIAPSAVARMQLELDANWLEYYAVTPGRDADFEATLERALRSPQLDEGRHVVVLAIEVIHDMLGGDPARAASRLRSLIDLYAQTWEFHADWDWTGLERRLSSDERFTGSEAARRVLVLTDVFDGPKTDDKVQRLRDVAAWLRSRRGRGGTP